MQTYEISFSLNQLTALQDSLSFTINDPSFDDMSVDYRTVILNINEEVSTIIADHE